MKIKTFFTGIAAIVVLIFSGCTQMYNSNEVDLQNTNSLLTYKTGVVKDIRLVTIKDDGSGTMIGALTGTVLGGLFGNGKGNVLTTLGGGLAGAYAGTEIDKANAQELFIKLDNGRHIAVVAKGVSIHIGDRVRLVLNGNKVVRVEKI